MRSDIWIAPGVTVTIYRNAAGPLGDLSYQYDQAGNRIAVGGSFARTLLPDSVATTSYDAANRQLAFADKTMTFDANGNLSSITEPNGPKTFVWDARNRLVGLQDTTTTGAFVYDASGRRIARTINDAISQYAYDGLDITQQVDSQGTTSYLRSLNIDEALSSTSSTGSFFLVSDTIGSTLAVTNTSGSVATEYRYDPFGSTISTDPAFPNLFQYTSRENDEISGMYFYRSRFYSPAAHRFLSEDPIGLLAHGANFYAYVRNNPLRFIDPLGLDKQAPQDFGEGPNPEILLSSAFPRASLPALKAVSDFSAGFGDTLTFGGTRWVRDHFNTAIGLPDTVDYNSVVYSAGGWAGVANSFALGGLGVARGAGWTTKVAIHGPHHTFGSIGRLSHIQINWWQIGVKGSGRAIRIPLPWR